MTPTIEDTSALPREASAHRLEEICQEISGASQSKKELVRELEENNDAVYDTIRLGEHLGLLRSSDQGIITTDLGKELINAKGRSKSDVFAEALSNHKSYCRIMQSLDEKGVVFEGPLERETVLTLLQEDYGVELSTKTLKERVGTLFQTLETADLGEYVFGTQNTICHFKFREGFRDRISPSVLNRETGIDKQITDPSETSSVQTTITGSPFSTDELDLDCELNSKDRFQFNIDIQIDDSTSPDHIEELILAIRRAIRSDL